ncbi:fluoride efflux transporter CrcB [Mycolicibacterium thermoresistibile]
MTSILLWSVVAVLGGAGAVSRHLVDRSLSRRWESVFPVGILVVNVSGALLLGVLAGVALSPRTALLAGTAFLGSYTTFSTWMLDTQRLAEHRQLRWAVVNIVGSVVLGVAAAAVGYLLGTQL